MFKRALCKAPISERVATAARAALAMMAVVAVAACSPTTPSLPPGATAANYGAQAVSPEPDPNASAAPSASTPAVAVPGSTPMPTLAPAVVTFRAPSPGVVVTKTKVAVTATAGAGQAPAGVTFTIAWDGGKERTACKAKANVDGSWSCTVDLAKLGAPVGSVRFATAIVDVAGQRLPGDGDDREITYAPSARPSWSWQVVSRESLYADTVVHTTSGRLVGSLGSLLAGSDAYCIDDVTGGWNAFGGLELPVFDPATGRVSQSAPSSYVNQDVTVVPISGGRVLVVGTATRQTEMNSVLRPAAEIYNPKTNRWTQTTTPGAAGPSAVALAKDRVALIGGSVGGAASDRVDLLTVSSGRLRTVAQLPKGVADSVSVLLADGRILVVPNRDGDKATYLVDPGTGSVRSVPSPAPGTWWSEAWTLPEGGAAIAAIVWNNRHGVLATAVLAPNGKSWSRVQRVTLGWDAWAIGHDASGRAIIAGGGRRNDNNCSKSTFTARVFAMDPRTGETSKLPDLPASGGVTCMTLLPDGRVMAGVPLGRNKADGVGILGP
jgi:hypothetical protein